MAVFGLWSLVLGGSLVFGLGTAEQTWSATISDSMCVRKHESGAEGQETTDPDCTRDCVRGGSKYVLVVGEKVYAVANQDHADLPKFAGQTVRVTGESAGDTITITSVDAPR
jgi:hypothetical protein